MLLSAAAPPSFGIQSVTESLPPPPSFILNPSPSHKVRALNSPVRILKNCSELCMINFGIFLLPTPNYQTSHNLFTAGHTKFTGKYPALSQPTRINKQKAFTLGELSKVQFVARFSLCELC